MSNAHRPRRIHAIAGIGAHQYPAFHSDPAIRAGMTYTKAHPGDLIIRRARNLPLYTYRCQCGIEQTEFNTIENRHKGPECHGRMELKITGTQIQAQILGGGTYQGYRCPVTNEWVTSRKRRRDIMKKHDLVEVGDASSQQRERKARVLEATNGSMTSD